MDHLDFNISQEEADRLEMLADLVELGTPDTDQGWAGIMQLMDELEGELS